ncbi:MAG TPA: DUF4157 domain-containing protein [Acidobacteriota bacterium]|jgi:hypothetical protein
MNVQAKAIDKADKAHDAPSRSRSTADHSTPTVLSDGFGLANIQQNAGNLAVQRMCQAGLIQAKLSISQPDDPYEQEADRVADQVMRMPVSMERASTLSLSESQPIHVQRSCAACAVGEPCRKCGEEQIQRKAAYGSSPAASAGVSSRIAALHGGGQPLPPSIRAFFEPRFNRDFGQVRVHGGPSAAETAKSIDARAFTVGRNIAFAAGQYAPKSAEGQRLLAHELTHVAQQGYGQRLAESKTLDAAYPSIGMAAPQSGRLVQRQGRESAYEGEGAGCGFCIEPAQAGIIAHEMIQSKMGALGVDNEVKVSAGRRGAGRLDLARWDETSIEIGEIKPGHEDGFARGEEDLVYYQRILEKTKDPKFQGKTVRRLAAPVPKEQIFPNPGVALPEPQKLKSTRRDGVYGYFCDESSRTYFEGAKLVQPGDKHVTRAVLKAKKEFFDSDCIKKKSKRKPVEEERVKIRDRAGATRLAKPAMALSILRSRAFHLQHEVDQLYGEHSLAHAYYVKTIVMGAIFGGPVFLGAAAAAIWTGMPSLSIWDAARAAAGKGAGAANVEEASKALAELEAAVVAPRQEFLVWKARRDGTPVPKEPNTPAPAPGAQPQQGAPPPLPPKPIAPVAPAVPGTTAPPAQAESGLSLTTIAALAAVVVITCLILQPEVGVAAVAGAATAGGEGALAAGTADVLVGAAAAAGETALEADAFVFVADEVVGTLAAL